MERVRVLIETSRGAFVKRRADARVDYLSVLPAPFNYGCVPGTTGDDGDPADALVLGPALPRGTVVDVEVYGVVRFVDAGRTDDKLVCSVQVPTDAQWRAIERFFWLFTRGKRALNRVRGAGGDTRLLGVERRMP